VKRGNTKEGTSRREKIRRNTSLYRPGVLGSVTQGPSSSRGKRKLYKVGGKRYEKKRGADRTKAFR